MFKSNYWVLKKKHTKYYLLAYQNYFLCQIGSNGIISTQDKQEGDLSTPKGKWMLSSIFYREDRIDLKTLVPNCKLGLNKITKNCGWCDDPSSENYNKYVKIKKRNNFTYERLWRKDNAYDILINLDHNQNPAIKWKGSAIFIHCSFDNLRNTGGCIALLKEDLIYLLKNINNTVFIKI